MNQNPTPPEPTVFHVQIVGAGLMASPLIVTAAGIALMHYGIVAPLALGPGLPNLLAILLLACGAVAAGGSVLLRRVLERRPAQGGRTLQKRLTIVILGLAVAEVPATLGLVLALITGGLAVPGVLWGLSLGVTLFHFPSRAWLESPE